MKCSVCNGKGFLPNSPDDCYACDGTGTKESDVDIRFDFMERAIENTGYRESGSEAADRAQGDEMPFVVLDEYRRLCKQRGVEPQK